MKPGRDLRVLLPVFAWFVARALQVRYLGWGSGFDVGLYQQYGRQWGAGAAAYVDFQPEYPPGALPIFFLPLLFGGQADYSRYFALEMACFDLAACVLVYLATRRRGEAGMLGPLLSSGLYLAVAGALYPVLYSRFDLVPGVLVLAAAYLAERRRSALSALLLGAAGAVKLWPLALVPLWFAWERRRSLGRAVRCTGLIGAGAVLASLPVLPRAGWQALSFLKYHVARGIQIETTWSTAALLLARLGLAEAHPAHDYGAFHVAGRLPSILAAISPPLAVLFAAAPALVAALRGFPGRPEDAFRHAAFGSIVGFMIAGKVLSPQYLLWIAPMYPLVAAKGGGAATSFMVAALTTAVYPYLSPALEQPASPGHGYALLTLGTRNMMLVGWYATSLATAGGFLWGRRTAGRQQEEKYA